MTKGNVLVTGSDGFTGSYVVKELESRGYSAFGTVVKKENVSKNFTLVDLLLPDDVHKLLSATQPDFIIHLAGVSFLQHTDKSEMYASNILGSRNLFQAASDAQNPITNIIVASSSQVYSSKESGAISEGDPFGPESDYAITKLAVEYLATGVFPKLPITIVRPFNYTGLGQATKFLVPKIVEHFANRIPEINLGNTQVRRDFSDVRTVARVYADLIDRPSPGNVFNICSAHTYSVDEVISMLREISGHNIKVNLDSGLVRGAERQAMLGDNTKLTRHLGETPSINFRDTLEWMMKEGDWRADLVK
jgi:nucleoside-diphosphate-sugar epimerase